jgi:hypothetical protein
VQEGTCSPLGLLLLELRNCHVHLPAAIHLPLLFRLLDSAHNRRFCPVLHACQLLMCTTAIEPLKAEVATTTCTATHPVMARWYLTTTSNMVRSIASSTAGYFFVKRAAPNRDSRTAQAEHKPSEVERNRPSADTVDLQEAGVQAQQRTYEH